MGDAEYGWKPWTGGKCPVRRGMLVEIMWSDGEKWPPIDDGEGVVWSHDIGHPKIVAYRTIKKHGPLDKARGGRA